jgi:hypothetical protein
MMLLDDCAEGGRVLRQLLEEGRLRIPRLLLEVIPEECELLLALVLHEREQEDEPLVGIRVVGNGPDEPNRLVEPAGRLPEPLCVGGLVARIVGGPVERVRLGAPREDVEQLAPAGVRSVSTVPGVDAGARPAARLDGEVTDVAIVPLVVPGRPARELGRHAAARAKLVGQPPESGCLPGAERRDEDVLRIQEDKHRGPPARVRSDPRPFRVEVLGVQLERRIGVLELAGAHRPEEPLQSLDRLTDAGRHVAGVRLRVDQQVIRHPARPGLERAARRLRGHHQRVAQGWQRRLLRGAHRPPQRMRDGGLLVDARLEDLLPLATRLRRRAPDGERRGLA